MNMGKTLGEKQLGVSWYTKTLPGKEGEEEASQEGIELLDQEEPEDDGYTPPQEDYLPPGLQVDTHQSHRVFTELVFKGT